jgi:hypothetical protein
MDAVENRKIFCPSRKLNTIHPICSPSLHQQSYPGSCHGESTVTETACYKKGNYSRLGRILWHVDPLLGNDLIINSYKIAVAK